MSHVSVLEKEWVDALSGLPLSVYVDGTLGAGGHANAVLHSHPEIQRFIGIDSDQDAIDIAYENLHPWREKLTLIQGNFVDFDNHMREAGVTKVDAILLDIGVSSMQLDQSERGFSFMRSGPLDMRMDRQSGITAEEIVNTWSEEELGKIFREYGEEKRWKVAAKAIVLRRKKEPIHSTKDLVHVLEPVLRTRSPKEIHPVTLVFQALRIAVNGELDAIKLALPQMIARLKSGGILGVISFHSLEDRIVKHAFLAAASDKANTSGLGGGLFMDKEPIIRILTRKPLTASKEEIASNPRSRSAKMRIVERL